MCPQRAAIGPNLGIPGLYTFLASMTAQALNLRIPATPGRYLPISAGLQTTDYLNTAIAVMLAAKCALDEQ